MISNYFRRLIFHICLCSTFAIKDVKILQLTTNLCNNVKCGSNQSIQLQNVINQNNTKVILWFSNFQTNLTLFNEMNITADVLPVYSSPEYHLNGCSLTSKLITDKACYYVHTLRPQNVSFVVLNTGLWLTGVNVTIAKEQMNWFKSVLKDFRRKQGKIIIVGYDTPGSLETSSTHTKYTTDFNNMFVELLKTFASTISACIFGGDGIDSFRIVLDNIGNPVIPIFIFPTTTTNIVSSIPNLRFYNFRVDKLIIDKYEQFHNDVTAKNGYNFAYSEDVHIDKLFEFTKLFPRFQKYHQFRLQNVSFSAHCHGNGQSCVECCSRCFIFHLVVTNLNQCLKECSNIKILASNNNVFYVLGVIIGFVVILLGIVLAVNKTYCIRRNRQRNIFLAPLTLDIHTDINDDLSSVNINGKLSGSKELVVTNSNKTLNGHRCSNHEIEQTYDYIRM